MKCTYVFAAIALLGSCDKENSIDCQKQPDDPSCAGDAGANSCTTNDSCSGATSLCETVSGMCVECIGPDQAGACTGAEPVCDSTNSCRGCTAHSECASAACLPDGSCASETDVSYVAPSGSGTACTKAAPCGLLDDAVRTNKPVVKIAEGLTKDDDVILIDGKKVTIVADAGAKIDRDGDGPILQIQSANADVSLSDVEVTGAAGTTDSAIVVASNGGSPKLTLTRCVVSANQGTGLSSKGGVVTLTRSTISSNQGTGISATGGAVTVNESTLSSNQGGGISATGGAVLTVAQSTVSANQGVAVVATGGTVTVTRTTIWANRAGGMSVTGGATFDITNTYVYRNGDRDNGAFGGLNLGIAQAGANRLQFNTIVDNAAATNSAGVICNAATFSGANNIIARNELAGSTTSATAQTSGACTYPTSKVQTDLTGLAFVDPEVPLPLDYKITATSTALDQATTSSAIDVDHDGDPRPSGTAKDIGADEYVP